MSRATLRILLADDHEIVLAAVEALLRSHAWLDVVGKTHDGESALKLCVELNPDLLLLDVVMPGMSGPECMRRLRAAESTCKVVALSGYPDPHLVREMVEAGAKGYVVKDASGKELLAALEAVARGGTYFSNAVADWRERSGVELSEREKEVLRLVSEGLAMKQIAQRLGLSVKTIETHRSHLMEKLRLRSTAALTKYALMRGHDTL